MSEPPEDVTAEGSAPQKLPEVSGEVWSPRKRIQRPDEDEKVWKRVLPDELHRRCLRGVVLARKRKRSLFAVTVSTRVQGGNEEPGAAVGTRQIDRGRLGRKHQRADSQKSKMKAPWGMVRHY